MNMEPPSPIGLRLVSLRRGWSGWSPETQCNVESLSRMRPKNKTLYISIWIYTCLYIYIFPQINRKCNYRDPILRMSWKPFLSKFGDHIADWTFVSTIWPNWLRLGLWRNGDESLGLGRTTTVVGEMVLVGTGPKIRSSGGTGALGL